MLDFLQFRQAYKNAAQKQTNAILAESMRILILRWDQLNQRNENVSTMAKIFIEMCSDDDPMVRKAGIRGLIIIGSTKLFKYEWKSSILNIISELLKKPIDPIFSEDLAWLLYLLVFFHK